MRNNFFKTMNEISNDENLNARLKYVKKQNSRIFSNTKLEDMLYKELRANDNGRLKEIEQKGNKRLDTFSSLSQDMFQALYSVNVQKNDEETLVTNAKIFNKEIIKHVMNCIEFPGLKSICEGRDLSSYAAISEFTEQIFNKLNDLLNQQNKQNQKDENNIHDILYKLEARQKDNIDNLKELLEKRHKGGLDDREESQAVKIANCVLFKQKQIDYLTEKINHATFQSKEKFQRMVDASIALAKEKSEQVTGLISSWGLQGSNPQTLKHNTELLERVKSNDKIMSIAKYLGKFREVLNNEIKNCYAFGRGDKYDIVLGNDYTRAISSEYAYLALPETVPLFVEKVQRKALKQYRKRERISKGHGHIVICLDESSSTKGEPIAWGKALALTLMEAAHRYKKNCAIVRFSGIGEVYPHYFLHDKFTTEDIFKFANSFLGGGTEFTGPLLKATDIIKTENFNNADLLFLTDGDCQVNRKFLEGFQKEKNNSNFSVTSIILDKGTRGTKLGVYEFSDKVFKLSEMAQEDVSRELIKKVA